MCCFNQWLDCSGLQRQEKTFTFKICTTDVNIYSRESYSSPLSTDKLHFTVFCLPCSVISFFPQKIKCRLIKRSLPTLDKTRHLHIDTIHHLLLLILLSQNVIWNIVLHPVPNVRAIAGDHSVNIFWDAYPLITWKIQMDMLVIHVILNVHHVNMVVNI